MQNVAWRSPLFSGGGGPPLRKRSGWAGERAVCALEFPNKTKKRGLAGRLGHACIGEYNCVNSVVFWLKLMPVWARTYACVGLLGDNI